MGAAAVAAITGVATAVPAIVGAATGGGGGSDDRSAEVFAKMSAEAAEQQTRMSQQLFDSQAQHSKEMREQQNKLSQMQLDQIQANQKYVREQDAKFGKYMAENTKLVAELEGARKTLEQELEKAQEKFLNQATDPDEYDKIQTDIFQKFCRKVEQVPDVPKTKKPSVAVLGQNGVGKSSLINTLAEEFVTPEGVTDTTIVVSKVYESPTTEYWDVPGCNEERSYTNLRQIMAIKEMHLIIIMYVDRVEHIVKLEKFVRACKVPYICVRSKVDQIVDADGKFAHDLKTEALELEAKKLSAPLIFVSAKTREGIDDLKSSAKKLGIALCPTVAGAAAPARPPAAASVPASAPVAAMRDPEARATATVATNAAGEANTGPVSSWDVEAVCSFLESLGLGSLAPALRENAVDGLMLQGLSEEDLVAELGLKKLQARKVYERLPR